MPAAAARIGVPSGTRDVDPRVVLVAGPMSRRRSRRRPAPLTGQIRPPLPPWIGPAGSGTEPVAASWAAILPWIAATSPSSSSSWSLISASAASRSARAATSSCWWLCRAARALASACSSAAIASRARFDPVLGARAGGRRSAAPGRAGRGPGRPPPRPCRAAGRGIRRGRRGRRRPPEPTMTLSTSGLPVSYIATSRSRSATRARLRWARSSSRRSLAPSSSATAASSSACLAASRAADRGLAGADRGDLAGQPLDPVACSGRSSWSARPSFAAPRPASTAWLRAWTARSSAGAGPARSSAA